MKVGSQHSKTEEESLYFLRDIAQKREEQMQYELASSSKQHSRRLKIEDDHRLPYKRDVDRIVHSKAFARYADKTQVVYLVENDHITHRGLHVQLVSNFARGIAEILRLNLDLVEAIALGHDVGHPPFGHEGENYLSSVSKKNGGQAFTHPHQSCRLFSEIEPLNLGLAVYDGFLCHDGGMSDNVIKPRFGKSWEDHFCDRECKLKDPRKNIIPGTLEGALVKLSDTISYVGKDIEDAISLNILSRDDIPKTYLGNNNRDILKTLATDIIINSHDKDYIALSDRAFEALKVLRAFNFRNIYNHEKLKVESEKIKKGYSILFETLLDGYVREKRDSYLWKYFLLNKNDQYFEDSSDIQFVIDFISGMTDKYFVKTLENLIVPKSIKI